MRQLVPTLQHALLGLFVVSIARHAEAQNDQPAMFMSRNTAVEYPRVLALANIEGEIVVELRVDTTGRLEPQSLRMRSAPFHDIALSAVRSAVETWQWSPALRGGRRVSEMKQYRFTFRISRAATPCPVSTVEHQIVCFEKPPVLSAYGSFRGYFTTGFESHATMARRSPTSSLGEAHCADPEATDTWAPRHSSSCSTRFSPCIRRCRMPANGSRRTDFSSCASCQTARGAATLAA